MIDVCNVPQVLSVREAQSLLKDEEDLVIAVYDYWLAKRLRLVRDVHVQCTYVYCIAENLESTKFWWIKHLLVGFK